MDSSIRDNLYLKERESLSEYAALAENTKGRQKPEEECPVRTPFQRDRDRIVHCAAFRRLMNKTQVFLAPEGDHYRTRLTHTLEVSQIARTIARTLRLNEDLTEAIALGHDLGHTPFGHAGERALDAVFPEGFKHDEQSLRVVDFIEKGGRGLNLTYEVRDGIVCHTRGKEADTLEGRIVKVADKIAYINHDIDDAIRAGVLKNEDIPKSIRKILGETKSQRINTLVISVTQNSTDDIRMAENVKKAFDEIHDFMFDKVYTNPICKSEEGKASDVVKKLYYHFCEYPEQMSEECIRISKEAGVERAACDYVSGMTDNFAINTFYEIYIPKSWQY
ncbi:MAG: deoxyguanosinetriphosphate triphosphohydrolase [Clostridiales bacterium]|nr:deoxyguanosinetriphosphate triphosphohydrolase [Clostridiales bacterium]